MKFTSSALLPLMLPPPLVWVRRIISCLAPSPAFMLVLALCLSSVLTAQGQTTTSQAVVGWGFNSLGTLGDNTNIERTFPVNLTHSSALNGKTIIQIVAGGFHSFALCSDGTLVGWGFDYYGQLGIGQVNGQTVLFPVNLTGSGALRGKTVVQVAAGDYHSLALCSDGTVAAWGCNYDGQLGDGSTSHRFLPTDITRNGALSGKKVTHIVAGGYHNFALCNDGSVVAWGRNDAGALGDGTRINRNLPITITNQGVLKGRKVIKLLGGALNNLALCSDGTLASWGNNTFGQLGDGTNEDRLLPVSITGKGALSGKTISQLSVGHFHNAILCTDGSVVVWGNNQVGALGDGTKTNRPLPISITGKGALAGKNVTQIALGSSNCVALCSDGTLASWGSNRYGAVGDGTLTQRNLPVAITGNGALKGKTITQLAAGGEFTLALTENSVPSTNLAPTVTIFSPTAKQILSLSDFNDDTISGSASDDKGITKVEIKLYRTRDGVTQIWNGTSFSSISTAVLATSSGTGPNITWKMGSKAPPQSQLDAGEYLFTVYAKDAEGSVRAANGTFTLQNIVPPADTQKPVPTINTPTSNQSLLISDFTSSSITGSATDNIGVARVEVKLYRNRNGVNQFWNGTSFGSVSTAVPATLSGTGTTVSWGMGNKTPPQSQLDAGVYIFSVYAKDAAGNAGATQGSFILRTPPPAADMEKPVPFISTPTAGQTLLIPNVTSSTFTGSATDNVGVSRVDLQLYRVRNGVTQFWNGTSFVTTKTWVAATLFESGTRVTWSLGTRTPPQSLLDEGVYYLVASATDAAGNVGLSEVRSFILATSTTTFS